MNNEGKREEPFHSNCVVNSCIYNLGSLHVASRLFMVIKLWLVTEPCHNPSSLSHCGGCLGHYVGILGLQTRLAIKPKAICQLISNSIVKKERGFWFSKQLDLVHFRYIFKTRFYSSKSSRLERACLLAAHRHALNFIEKELQFSFFSTKAL